MRIEELAGLAEKAGKEIARIYRSGDWDVTAKGDDSPLTQADLVSNRILVEGLRSQTNEPIVSEENDPTSVRVDVKAPFWLIDPLDGTRDFVRRLDTFVICIARIVDGSPVFGLIHAPLTGETWWAEKNRGAFGPKGERLINRRTNQDLVAMGSRSVPSERMLGFLKHFRITEVLRIGSALKFCRLAEGAIDLYPRFGVTSEWDTAAGQIIAEEAGCKVIDIQTGLPLRYGKPRFENAGGFMASRVDLDLVGELHRSGMVSLKP